MSNIHLEQAHKMTLDLQQKIKPHLESAETLYGLNDFRQNLIGLPFSVIMMQILNHHASLKTLYYNKDWYNEINIREDKDKLNFSARWASFTKFMFLFKFLSNVESVLRMLIRQYIPENNGRGKYWDVYTKIFKGLELDKHIPLYQFTSTIRNTIHNNGYFYPTGNGDEVTHVFNEKEYKFRAGEAVKFVTPEFMVQIEDAVFDSLLDLLHHESIKKLSATKPDELPD